MPNAKKPALTEEPQAPEELKPDPREEIWEWLLRIQTRAPDSKAEWQWTLDERLNLPRTNGELAGTVVLALTASLGGKDPAFCADVVTKLESMRADLLGEGPTPVEQLLVERVVACWLQVQDAELRYAQRNLGIPTSHADHYQRRIDAANRRLLAAIRSLVLVRKLDPPALRLTAAQQKEGADAAGTPER